MDQTPCTIFRACFAQKLGLDAVWFGSWPQMDRRHFDTHLLVLVICRGKAPPSCYARPFCRLKAPLGLSLLRYASQTRTFENTLISAACKKKQGKLRQKERGPDGASPLDRMMRCSKISAAFIAVFKNSAEQNGIFTICSLHILLRWENRIRQKDKVSAGKIRTRQ